MGQNGNSDRLHFLGLFIFKITAVTAAMKLKDALAPWKKSYDHPRQHIKKQRHHFADKGPYSQSCVFSSSYIWM